MMRRAGYSFLRVYIYRPVLLVLFLIGYIRRSNWTMVAALVGVYCVASLYALYLRRQAFSKRLEKMNAMRPDRVTLTSDGVQGEGPNGAASFSSCGRSFEEIHCEGKRVILLERNEGKQIHILPVGQLSDMDRALRSASSCNRTSSSVYQYECVSNSERRCMQVICSECGHPFDDDQCCYVCAARGLGD